MLAVLVIRVIVLAITRARAISVMSVKIIFFLIFSLVSWRQIVQADAECVYQGERNGFYILWFSQRPSCDDQSAADRAVEVDQQYFSSSQKFSDSEFRNKVMDLEVDEPLFLQSSHSGMALNPQTGIGNEMTDSLGARERSREAILPGFNVISGQRSAP